jgi:thiamine biosynthesis lipoprotein
LSDFSNQPQASRSLDAWFETLGCASLARAAAELLAAPEPEQSKRTVAGPATLRAEEAPASQSIPTQLKPIRDTLLLTISRQAMACEWEVLLNQHQYSQGAEHAMRALDLVEQFEALHSVFRTHSDLIAVNRFGATRPVAVARDTLVLLQLARDIHALTEGAFDITAGSLSQAWGFSRRSGRMPTDAEIVNARQFVGDELITLDEAEKQVALAKPGVALNPGGIGKGYALDRAGGRLISSGVLDFMMHGGLSSVVAHGNRQHSETGGGWLVALKHPWRWEEQLGTLRLRNQALATSGSGKQFFHYQGQRYSHIIDPRSGWPAQGMMSTTVICPSAAVADALATALFVLGPEKSREFCEQHPAISAVLVYSDPKSGSTSIETCNLTDEAWMPRHG